MFSKDQGLSKKIMGQFYEKKKFDFKFFSDLLLKEVETSYGTVLWNKSEF